MELEVADGEQERPGGKAVRFRLRRCVYPVRRAHTAALITIIILLAGSTPSIVADSAPPWYAQGASVEASESMTHVQMASEEVLLVVEKRQEIDPEIRGLAAGYMTGHVEATFVMRNHGPQEESFDVWFPLGTPPKYSYGDTIQNFAAWVDEIPAETGRGQTRDEWDHPVSWATWPVTFPPGQDVLLRVTYDVLPIGYGKYGRFEYVLETGAGWWGLIKEGTVTIRYPHEVNASTTILHRGGRGIIPPDPASFTISGNEVIWHFSDLEPTEDDNICLTVLAPQMWEEITAAQRDVAAMPDSPEAHLRLARALVAPLQFETGGGLSHVGNSVAFAELAEASFQRALELDPKNAEAAGEYIEFQRSMTQVPFFTGLTPTSGLDSPSPGVSTPRPTASPASVATLAPTPAPSPTIVSIALASLSPLATHSPLATPAAGPTIAFVSPLATPTPPLIVTPTPQPEGGGKPCYGAIATAALPLGVLWAGRVYVKRRARGEMGQCAGQSRRE